MRKRTIRAGWIAAVLVLASANSLVAHHSLSQFDTTTAVRVKGTIVLFERVNPHSVLFIDQKREDGQIQRWAVDGPSTIQLNRIGIDKAALKAGDIVEVCGYVMKDGVESQRTIYRESTPKSVSGRIMNGELLVMPDGQKRVWSDYGHHKCLGSDYVDAHIR